MPERKRYRWGSHRGFLLATLGSAVGLGNVWRFSYEVGQNGGGAFLLVYLAMVCLVGVPLLLGEFAIGRRTQRESAAAFGIGRSDLEMAIRHGLLLGYCAMKEP